MINSTQNLPMPLPPKHAFRSASALSKEFISTHKLQALLVEENYLFEDEGRCLMQAFRAMGESEFLWCKVDGLLNGKSAPKVYSCACEYDAFVMHYLEFEDGIQYWDRLMYLANAHVYVLHTAYGHLIYAGPTEFVSAIDVIEKPTVINDWLQVVGRYYPDPALEKEYQFKALLPSKE